MLARAWESARWRLKSRRDEARYRLHGAVTNRRARLEGVGAPELGAAQRTAVEALRRDGIAITHFDELVGDGGRWQELAAVADEFAAAARSRIGSLAAPTLKSDYVIRRPEEGSHPTIAADDPLLRLGTSPEILDVVNAYRGLWMKLVNLELWYTIPFLGGTERVASQRWHRDPRDSRIVKVFVYFSDVDEGAGPLQYVSGSTEGGPYGGYFPWRLHGAKYPPDDEFAQRIPESAWVTATGRAGTVVFCDTSGFHRGGYATTTARVSSVQHYVSPAAVAADTQPRLFSVAGEEGVDEVDTAASFALR